MCDVPSVSFFQRSFPIVLQKPGSSILGDDQSDVAFKKGLIADDFLNYRLQPYPVQVHTTGFAVCAHTFVRITYTRKIISPYRSTDRCFKHATKSRVALDIAWPWANDAYGLC